MYPIVLLNIRSIWPSAFITTFLPCMWATLTKATAPLSQPLRFQDQYRKRTIKAAQALCRKAGECGIHCEHLVKFGDLGSTVGALHHEVKRIEFVITDSEVNKEDIFAEVTIPVFSVTPTYWWSEQGGKTMASELAAKKSKPVAKTIMYGIAAAALYAGVFAYSDTVMKYFTRGSWYAALPIATVFPVFLRPRDIRQQPLVPSGH